MREHKRGFTLIEVLVSVAIVLVLAGIVFAVGRATVHAAKCTACASDLRQLGTAYQLYVADNDGYVPPYFLGDGSDALNVAHKSMPALWKAALIKFGASDGQFYCPLDDLARKEGYKESNDVDHRFTSYSYGPGVLYYSEKGHPFLKLSVGAVPEPSRTVLLLDDGWFSGSPGFDLTAHGESRNLLFFDTHVREESTHVPPCWFPGQQKGC